MPVPQNRGEYIGLFADLLAGYFPKARGPYTSEFGPRNRNESRRIRFRALLPFRPAELRCGQLDKALDRFNFSYRFGGFGGAGIVTIRQHFGDGDSNGPAPDSPVKVPLAS